MASRAFESGSSSADQSPGIKRLSSSRWKVRLNPQSSYSWEPTTFS